ncbi:MAG: RNA 2',3'-cyclic phosphodiesterase [Nanobdellota archaeon]
MRLFIAIDCNDLEKYFSRLQATYVPSDARSLDTFHLTLLFLGNQSESKLNKLIRSLDNVSGKSFRMTFDHLSFFSIKRKRDIFWVGIKEKEIVSILQRQITKQLTSFGIQPQKRFIPHVTIARRKRMMGSTSIQAKRQPVARTSINVNSFKLIQSTITPEGPIYTIIKEFKLK